MKHFIFKAIFIILLGLVACSGQSDAVFGNGGGDSAEQTIFLPTVVASEAKPIDEDSKLKIIDIAPIPDNFPNNIRTNFNRYTQVVAPNGKPITIYAQDSLSEAQIIQARNTLIFWLTDVPGSQYGADKAAVANKMGDNGAALNLLNGVDDGRNPAAELGGQPLYFGELVAPGSTWYINNDFEHRDATFEEILHLMHDTGIGVDGDNASPGALPDFQAGIRAATDNAIANNFQIWPTTAANGGGEKQWFDELKAENSLTQEYLAAVIDSYYGLWGPFTEANAGMWGFYIAQTRSDIQTKDPMGWALMEQFFSPYLTYNNYLDPTFDGTFTMTFDASTPYTHKSQYMLHATLNGSNNSNLTGNDQDNELGGNSGNNTLDGLAGNDTAVFAKAMSAYIVTKNADGSVTAEGDGTDTLVNIEQIRFSDQTVQVADL